MENWKSISNYEGLYEVSDLGRVRSLKFGKTRILKPVKVHGYLSVMLCKDGICKHMQIHRLVAEAFIPNPQNLETVNHRNEVKTDNSVLNLEWLTRGDNIRYSFINNPKWSKQVQMLDKKTGEPLATFPSIQEASRQTGIFDESICSCCKGKRKSAGGYVWRYF